MGVSSADSFPSISNVNIPDEVDEGTYFSISCYVTDDIGIDEIYYKVSDEGSTPSTVTKSEWQYPDHPKSTDWEYSSQKAYRGSDYLKIKILAKDTSGQTAQTSWHYVEIINPPELEVNPSSYDFGSINQGETPTTKIEVENQGEGDLEWYVSDNPSWVSIRGGSDTTGGGKSEYFYVDVKSSISVGHHEGDIKVVSNAGSEYVEISVDVTKSIEELAINPTETEINVGETTQFDLAATYSDGSKEDITSKATWSSDNQDVLISLGEGSFEGEKMGEALALAKYDGKSVSAKVSVIGSGVHDLSVKLVKEEFTGGLWPYFNITAVFENLGDLPESSTYIVKDECEEILIKDSIELTPGEKKKSVIDLGFNKNQCLSNISVLLDPEDTINEVNETNNFYSISIPELPIIDVLSPTNQEPAQLEPSSPSQFRVNVSLNLKLSVDAIEPKHLFEVYIGGQKAEIVDYKPIPAGCYEILVTPPSMESGVYSLEVRYIHSLGYSKDVEEQSVIYGSWKQYIPKAEDTSIQIQDKKARVDLSLAGGLYRADSWGEVNKNGNNLYADSKIQFLNTNTPSPTELSNDYALGELEEGAYTFTFKSYGENVKSQNFEVKSNEGVKRQISNKNPAPGEEISIQIIPHDLPHFYAVSEDIGSLEYIGHSADSNPDSTPPSISFSMLTPESFSYQVKIPEDASKGDVFPLKGTWWYDPEQKHEMEETKIVVGEQSAQTNLLLNPDFEQGLTHWKQTGGSASYTAFSCSVSGSYCVKGVETNTGNLGRLYQDVTEKLEAGKKYKIGGWLKTENVEGATVIALDYVDDNGWTPEDGYVKEIGYVNGSKDWTYHESEWFILPPMPNDASRIWFLIDFNDGKGTAWWDNVYLIEEGSSIPTPTPNPTTTSNPNPTPNPTTTSNPTPTTSPPPNHQPIKTPEKPLKQSLEEFLVYLMDFISNLIGEMLNIMRNLIFFNF